MNRQQKAEHLIRRAAALEATLAKQLRSLDPDLLERFSATVLELGFIENEQIERIFELATSRTLAGAYTAFAKDTADMEGLPLALGRVNQSADSAVASLVKDLSDKARLALRASVEQALAEGWSVPQLARVVKRDIGLTAKQAGWVRNFEAELRGSPGAALKRELRDRRFDPTLRRGEKIPAAKVERMVERYRERWLNYRAKLIARQELIRASHTANQDVWTEADERGDVPSYIRKFWWHSHDSLVRNSHVQIPKMNPRGVGVREAFVTPLGRLRYPCDPMGADEDTIGCRCAVIFETTNPETNL